MSVPRKTMTGEEMRCLTEHARYRVQSVCDLAVEMIQDPKGAERKSAQECIACYYSGHGGASVMTSRPCGLCGQEQPYPSSCTDALCLSCARKHDLCKHCGGDIKMRVRRKNWPRPDEKEGLACGSLGPN